MTNIVDKVEEGAQKVEQAPYQGLGNALSDLSDIMLCFANDFHYLHLLVKGTEFDELHKDVLKTYYEQAQDDYDEFAEWAVGLDGRIGNGCASADRLKYAFLKDLDAVKRDEVIEFCEGMLAQIVAGMNILLQSLKDQCALSQGLGNYLQTRLEYWGKEYAFFNRRRASRNSSES